MKIRYQTIPARAAAIEESAARQAAPFDEYRRLIAELEGSRVARDAFGDFVIDHYLHFARTELAAIHAQVSDAERVRYFERV